MCFIAAAPLAVNMALAASAAAAVAAGYSSYRQARAQESAARYNARMMELKQKDALARGDAAEIEQRKRTAALIGRQRNLAGGTGADVELGAPSLLVEDALAQGEQDAMNLRNNAMREAWGLEAQESLFRYEAKEASSAKVYGTGASLLGGAASTFGIAANYEIATMA